MICGLCKAFLAGKDHPYCEPMTLTNVPAVLRVHHLAVITVTLHGARCYLPRQGTHDPDPS